MKYILFLVFLLIACNPPFKKDVISNKEKGDTSLIIRTDSIHFTNNFLKGISNITKGCGFREVILNEHNIILDTAYTVSFPEKLVIGKNYCFKSKKGTPSFILNLKRLNQIQIQYDAKILSGSATAFSQYGFVELNPGFLLAAEVWEDEETGEVYLADNYIDHESTNTFAINISSVGSPQALKVIWITNNKIPLTKSMYSPVLQLQN